MSPSFTKAIIAGARSPLVNVYAASSTNATSRKMSAEAFVDATPTRSSTACIPVSCSAMYGITDKTPVSATASSSRRLPKRSCTKSAVVTYPRRFAMLQNRAMIKKTSGYAMVVYGTAKNASAPAPNASAGTAMKVYAV